MVRTIELAPNAIMEYDGDITSEFAVRAGVLYDGYFEIQPDAALTKHQVNIFALRSIGATQREISAITGRGLDTVLAHSANGARRLGLHQLNAILASQFNDTNYVVKSSIDLEPFGLTEKEISVLRMHASGLALKDVAVDLDIPLETVRSRCKQIIAKLGMRNMVAACTLFNISESESYTESHSPSDPIANIENTENQYCERTMCVEFDDSQLNISYLGDTAQPTFSSIEYNDGRFTIDARQLYTPQEANALALVATGMTSRQMAEILETSTPRLATVLKNLRTKARTKTNAEMVHLAFKTGVFEVDQECQFDVRLTSDEQIYIKNLAHSYSAAGQSIESDKIRERLFSKKLYVQNDAAAITTAHMLGIL